MYHIKDDKRNKISCELIIAALKKLTQNKDYTQITISELTHTAGVGRSTFYRAFDSIDDVLQYQIDNTVNELFEYEFPILRKKSHTTEKQIFLLFFEFWQQHINIIITLMKCNKIYLLENSFRNLFKTKLTFIQDILNIHTYKWEYFITMRIAMLISVLNQWVYRGCKETPVTIANILVSVHDSELFFNEK